MPKFFVGKHQICNDIITVSGNDGVHAVKVLRLNTGDKVTICDGEGTDYICTIISTDGSSFTANVNGSETSRSEPSIKVTLYQAVPKGDKMDYIVQKAVEMGVHSIVPVITKRCVVKLDEKDAVKKCERWQKIAFEAAKQCGRGIIPSVSKVVDFNSALIAMAESKKAFLLYENSKEKRLADVVFPYDRDISFMIGSEGGFEASEAEESSRKEIPCIGLGPRVLRTETASGCVLSIIMHVTGNI